MGWWMRHQGGSRFHAIAMVVPSGSTVTRCRGRWPSIDNSTLVEEQTNPPHEERCLACTAALVDLGMIERGLRELRDFDTSDVERGGEG